MSHLSSLIRTLGITLTCAVLWHPAGAQEKPPAPAAEAANTAHETAAKTAPRPRAMVAQPVVDLGEVTYGDSKAVEFVIKNTGTETLRIHSAKSGCACAVLDFTPEIAPGAEGKVNARFEASLSGGPSAIPVDVTSNDPDSPVLQLTIKADIKYFVNAEPGYVRYIVVQDFDGDSTIKQFLWALDGNPFKVTKVEKPYDFVEASFREAAPTEIPKDAPKDRPMWVVETRISPKSPIGPLTGFLTIHLDHPKQKLMKLELNGFVRPMFAVTPAAADWGELTMKAEGLHASVMVKNYAAEKVAVTGAESSVAGISTEIQEVDPGRSYWVRLIYQPDMPKGPFSGVLRIKTESPKRPVIEVPLRGTIL